MEGQIFYDEQALKTLDVDAADVKDIKHEPRPSTTEDVLDASEKEQVKTVEVEAEDNDFAEGDLKNPLNWPRWHKWTIVVLVSILSMLE